MESVRRQAMFSWLALGLLAILFSVLAALQYRWIGEVSMAERTRLRDNLQSGLNRVSRDFNAELARALASLQPTTGEVSELGVSEAYARRYLRWKSASKHPDLFRSVAIAIPEGRNVALRAMDLSQGSFSDVDWPDDLRPLRAWMTSRLEGRSAFGNQGGRGGGFPRTQTTYIEWPRFEGATGLDPFSEPAVEKDWLVLNVNLDTVVKKVLPEMAAAQLGSSSANDYDMELTSRFGTRFRMAIPGMEPEQAADARRDPDASTAIFETRPEPQRRGRGGPPDSFEESRSSGPSRRSAGRLPSGSVGPSPGPAGGPPQETGRGRWVLSAWHHAGSLDVLVKQARWRNLGVAFGLLLLMIGTVVALLRFSQQAQKLADMQVQFVAGVSHELRTPLTVIRTAAYNLRGRITGNPAQVERYGKLIQDESEKLSAIVDQVMLFASAKGGQLIRERKPFPVENMIEESLRSIRSVLEAGACSVTKEIDPHLPIVLGDSVALQHAVQNLIHNAVKYGLDSEKWIGVRAMRKSDPGGGDRVEISVEDHGPGIQPAEVSHIFDPFFRGERAVRDQIHGTGLGLNLVKQIVEAHGGTVNVESEPGRGTRFVLSIPAAPEQYQDEFANSVS